MAPIPADYDDFWSQGGRLHPEIRRRENFLEAFAFGNTERMAAGRADLVLQKSSGQPPAWHGPTHMRASRNPKAAT